MKEVKKPFGEVFTTEDIEKVYPKRFFIRCSFFVTGADMQFVIDTYGVVLEIAGTERAQAGANVHHTW